MLNPINHFNQINLSSHDFAIIINYGVNQIRVNDIPKDQYQNNILALADNILYGSTLRHLDN